MIDWNLPLRLVATKRQVYLVYRCDKSGWVRVGIDDQWGSGGVSFNKDGSRLPGFAYAPGWEEVENFDPLAELMAEAKIVVDTPDARKRRAEISEAVADNPLFGMF